MTPSQKIDKSIKDLGDWRGQKIARLRELIHEVQPDIVEDWKWSAPVFIHKGIVCALGSFKDHVKINFFKGSQIADPNKLFNSGLESKSHRGIDIFKDDELNESAIKSFISTAITLNTEK